MQAEEQMRRRALKATGRARRGAAGRRGILVRWLRARLAAEDGSVLSFALILLIVMLMVGGMAVDVMRYENTRAELQSTLDRAVLAAASLDNTLDPRDVVNSYFAKSGLEGYRLSVDVSQGLNFKTVKATASAPMPSMFLNMLGINRLKVQAKGGAEERINKVEISLVLDISGSMQGRKLELLKDAAKDFVDSLLTEQSRDMVSITLVPYSGQVNAGKMLFDAFNVTKSHDYSYCIEFDSDEFGDAALDFTRARKQVQHFEYSSYSYSPIRRPVCPAGAQDHPGEGGGNEKFAITAFEQDADRLKDRIDELEAISSTGTQYGVKWGLGLLDPSARDVVKKLARNGKADPAFIGRPLAWDDPEALKVLIVMSDGENTDQYRISDWAYDSPEEITLWNDNTLWSYLYYNVWYPYWGYFYHRIVRASQADADMLKACSAAKEKGAVVFTIGFETTAHSADVLEQCATSPAHYYDVDGIEISEAFSAIAATVQKLKLIE